MARHEHLPIYKAALDLTVHLECVVAGFSRYRKYTLGTELRQGGRTVLEHCGSCDDACCRGKRYTMRDLTPGPAIPELP